MKNLKEYILEAKLDPNNEDNKVIDYVITSFNDHFDEFIKGVKKIQNDWDCDINDIVKVYKMPYDKVKMESIKTLYSNLSKYNINIPKAKSNDLSFEIEVNYYIDKENITGKASDYILQNKEIDKIRDEYIYDGYEFNLNAIPNKIRMFIVNSTNNGKRNKKWISETTSNNVLDDIKDAVDNFCYKSPLFEDPNKITSAKDVKSKINKIKELMNNTKLEKHTHEIPITKLINKQSDVVKYIFNDILNVSAMDVYWDKETIKFGEEFVKLVSKWAKDIKSTNDLTVLSSKPKYWKDLTEVEITKTTRNKVNSLASEDTISSDEWIEVSTNGDYLVIVADMHDAGSDYFDMVIKK